MGSAAAWRRRLLTCRCAWAGEAAEDAPSPSDRSDECMAMLRRSRTSRPRSRRRRSDVRGRWLRGEARGLLSQRIRQVDGQRPIHLLSPVHGPPVRWCLVERTCLPQLRWQERCALDLHADSIPSVASRRACVAASPRSSLVPSPPALLACGSKTTSTSTSGPREPTDSGHSDGQTRHTHRGREQPAMGAPRWPSAHSPLVQPREWGSEPNLTRSAVSKQSRRAEAAVNVKRSISI